MANDGACLYRTSRIFLSIGSTLSVFGFVMMTVGLYEDCGYYDFNLRHYVYEPCTAVVISGSSIGIAGSILLISGIVLFQYVKKKYPSAIPIRRAVILRRSHPVYITPGAGANVITVPTIYSGPVAGMYPAPRTVNATVPAKQGYAAQEIAGVDGYNAQGIPGIHGYPAQEIAGVDGYNAQRIPGIHGYPAQRNAGIQGYPFQDLGSNVSQPPPYYTVYPGQSDQRENSTNQQIETMDGSIEVISQTVSEQTD